jgi:uncharacterized protein (TIGR02145 family)
MARGKFQINGTPLQKSIDSLAWISLQSAYPYQPSFGYYKNDSTNDTLIKYGVFYNWIAMSSNKLAPSGWRVASIEDWQKLESYLSLQGFNFCNPETCGTILGKCLASQTGWLPSNLQYVIGNSALLNNKTGFSAYPTGYLAGNGVYAGQGVFAEWWTYSQTYSTGGMVCNLAFDGKNLTYAQNAQSNIGVPVRLVRTLSP